MYNEGEGLLYLVFGIWGAYLVFWICMMIFGLLFFIFYAWMVVDVLQRKFSKQDDKLMWVLIVILVPFGDVVYFFTERKKHLTSK